MPRVPSGWLCRQAPPYSLSFSPPLSLSFFSLSHSRFILLPSRRVLLQRRLHERLFLLEFPLPLLLSLSILPASKVLLFFLHHSHETKRRNVTCMPNRGYFQGDSDQVDGVVSSRQRSESPFDDVVITTRIYVRTSSLSKTIFLFATRDPSVICIRACCSTSKLLAVAIVVGIFLLFFFYFFFSQRELSSSKRR